MLCDGPVILSLEQHLKRGLFVLSWLHCEALDQHVAFAVFLDVHGVGAILIEQIRKIFVVEFEIGDGNFYLMLVAGIDFLIQGREHSRDDASIFVVSLGACHRKSLPSTRLSVAQHAS